MKTKFNLRILLKDNFTEDLIRMKTSSLFEYISALQEASDKTFQFIQSAVAVEYINCFSSEGLDFPDNECPRYDTKPSDGKVPIMLELWGMWSTPSLTSLPDPLWSEVVVSDRVLSLCQIELNCALMLN